MIVFNNIPIIMGILNVTPDSFSDGGLFFDLDSAVKYALYMYSRNIDIIDIGGESTRPGSESIDYREEISRVIPVIKKIKSEAPEIRISIDTYKYEVASEALEYGVEFINDISGGSFDNRLFSLLSMNKVQYILMHIKGKPKEMQIAPYYDDVIEEEYMYFEEKLQELKNLGITEVIIDPGIGFGKRYKDNIEIIRSLYRFKPLNKKIMIGLSRKSFLKDMLDLSLEQRDHATSLLNLLSFLNGADYIRTHNIEFAYELKRIIAAISEYN